MRSILGALRIASVAFGLAACSPRALPDVVLDGDTALEARLASGGGGIDQRVDGKTALHVAAEEGDARSIRVLLAHHADVGALDGEGHPPLVVAALRGHAECVEALLAGGADPNQASSVTEMRATHAAAVAHNRASETLDVLLRHGADPNAVNASGETALHVAAKIEWSRGKSVADTLLRRGANPAARDVRGFTALHVAAARDNLVVVRIYVAMKGDLNGTSAWGQTPLDVAFARGSDAVADALISAGASTALTRGALAPLFAAARTNDVPRLQRLLALGADREQIHDGKTARDVARESGSDDALRMLGAPPGAAVP